MYLLTLEPVKISPTPIKDTGPMDTYVMPENDFESSVHLYVHVPTRLLARMAFWIHMLISFFSYFWHFFRYGLTQQITVHWLPISFCAHVMAYLHYLLHVKFHPHQCNNNSVGSPKLKMLQKFFYQILEYKHLTGVYPLHNFHEICRVCTSFQDLLAVKIWMDLLKGLQNYGGFKFRGTGLTRIFSNP